MRDLGWNHAKLKTVYQLSIGLMIYEPYVLSFYLSFYLFIFAALETSPVYINTHGAPSIKTLDKMPHRM